MIRHRTICACIMAVFFISSCATFIKDEELPLLKAYEETIYILKKDVRRNDYILKKGQKVKIFIRIGDESIKVYCYPSEEDFLKSERILILYIFNEDFENEVFDIAFFEENLNNVIQTP